MAKHRSTTISDHLDEYLDLLCAEFGVSKSSLMADLIDMGLNTFVKSMLDRNRLATQIKSGVPEVEKQPKGVAARQDRD